jgi:hypothetical protein
VKAALFIADILALADVNVVSEVLGIQDPRDGIVLLAERPSWNALRFPGREA